MKRTPVTAAIVLVAGILVAMGAVSCSKKLRHIVIPNQLPTVTLTAAPIDTTARCSPDPVRSCYSLTLNWVGYDSDGRVDHYLYAIDPPSGPNPDTTWLVTQDNEKRFLFESAQALPQLPNQQPLSRDFHVFVIKAVDNRGGVGPYVARAFFSYTEAPSVAITDPLVNHLLIPLLTPSVRITWAGNDRDGVFTSKPVKYKFTLISSSSPVPIDAVLINPDSLRKYYAPNFIGWDSSSAETTTATYTNLTPGQHYVFAVVAFDEAGAYSPIMSFDSNLLHFTVGFAGTLGPKITMFNEFFNYTYRTGGWCPCEQSEVFIEIPAAIPSDPSSGRLTVNWFADPPAGALIESYRWALDIADVEDETPRRSENDPREFNKWSSRSEGLKSVTLGPFQGNELHRLYIEADDNIGLRSLGILRFQVVRLDPHRDLAIVDDTRLRTDNRGTAGCVARPLGPWPTAAELDTFMYAVGGVPYQCYPTGTVSKAGVFHGYDFDTISTRLQKKDLTIRLAKLGEYRHIVWLIDGLSATYFKDGTDGKEPQTSLRYMCSPSRVNTLAAYVKQGGKVWMAGGGAAYASSIPWNDLVNDRPTTTFSATTSTRRELVPGRFMYDVPHWQSEYRIAVQPSVAAPQRYFSRLEYRPDPGQPYSTFRDELPAQMRVKSAGIPDSMPPNRTNPTDFYLQNFDMEFLQQANRIEEDLSGDPDHPDLEPTLDTLYFARGGSLPDTVSNRYNVVMSYYHGPAIPQGFMFTGFSVWAFKRADCVAVVDFVLHRLWGLNRSTAPNVRAERVQAGGPARPDASRPSWMVPRGTFKPFGFAKPSRATTVEPSTHSGSHP